MRLDGREGFDSADILGLSSKDSTVRLLPDNGVTVVDRTGKIESFTLDNFESISFEDMTFDLSSIDSVNLLTNDRLADLAELYVAYFNRAADATGLFFWADALAEGMSFEEISNLFFGQPETQAIYPNQDDTANFVASVYQNVLGRNPDASGAEFWFGEVRSGSVTNGQFVAEILDGARAGSSESDVAYLNQKTQLGLNFGVVQGLTALQDAVNVMEIFGPQSDADFARALAEIDHLGRSETSDQFQLQLVGFDPSFSVV